jgi:3-oxoacyl-[acyl-carrier protein] reductase
VETKKLTGKVAFVTGAAKGIGKAVVERFLQDGAQGIAMLDLDAARLEEACADMRKSGRLLPLQCDVSDRESVKRAVEETILRFGKIDILVNNAGIVRDAMFHKMTDEAWELVLKVNLGSMYNTCKFIVPRMREQNYGRIVNVSSVSAFGNIGQSNYSASKAAAIGFTKTLAKECGPRNITANCVAPGYIKTDMFNSIPEATRQEFFRSIPLKRLGEPAETAGVIAFLSCDDSSYLTGQCLIVSGGADT